MSQQPSGQSFSFSSPVVAHRVAVSPNGQYIATTENNILTVRCCKEELINIMRIVHKIIMT